MGFVPSDANNSLFKAIQLMLFVLLFVGDEGDVAGNSE